MDVIPVQSGSLHGQSRNSKFAVPDFDFELSTMQSYPGALWLGEKEHGEHNCALSPEPINAKCWLNAKLAPLSTSRQTSWWCGVHKQDNLTLAKKPYCIRNIS